MILLKQNPWLLHSHDAAYAAYHTVDPPLEK